MSLRHTCATAVALLAVTITAATPGPRSATRHLKVAPGSAPLMAFGGRSAGQMKSGFGGKLDAALADIARHAGTASSVAGLRAMNPAVKFVQRGTGTSALVAVDAVTRGDPQLLKAALESLGLEHAAVFRNDVGGWLPVSAIESAAARAEVTSLRASMSRTRAVVATQGDFVQGTAALRTTYGALNGSGVTVGVLSDSFDCYSVYAANQGQNIGGIVVPPATGPTGYANENGLTADAEADESSGALPATVNVLQEPADQLVNGVDIPGCIADFGYPIELPFADEGRAMLQIVHAVAPGASLAFYTADNSEADFASGIQALATAGAKVIADDVAYFDEPFFQTGIVGQSIEAVYGQGVAYFTAAGNDSNLAYDNTTPKFDAGSGPETGETLLNFDATGASTSPTLTINVPALIPGEFLAVVVEWDQPYVTGYPNSPGASSQIDVCVTAPAGYSVFNLDGTAETCTGLNQLGTDPVQVLVLGNPANVANGANSAPGTVNISVGLAAGSAAPGHIKVLWEDDGAGSTFANFAPTNNPTILGHANDPDAATVGAAFFADTVPCGTVTTTQLESYSSLGGSPILFDDSGNRLATPVMPQKPDFVAPDGVNTTFFGFFIAAADDTSTVAGCANDTSLPNYFGTSAATPHAAGLAALMLQANTKLTPTQIYTAIESSADAMDNPSPDLATGYGFIKAQAALAGLPAGAPIITVSPATITVGQSATVAWNGINATSCSGSGALSTSATSGSMSVTPTGAGTQTYTLTCTTASGNLSSSATLTVNAAPPPAKSGGGGGGSLGDLTLLVLAGMLLARLRLRRHAPGRYASVRMSANTKPSRSTTSPRRT